MGRSDVSTGDHGLWTQRLTTYPSVDVFFLHWESSSKIPDPVFMSKIRRILSGIRSVNPPLPTDRWSPGWLKKKLETGPKCRRFTFPSQEMTSERIRLAAIAHLSSYYVLLAVLAGLLSKCQLDSPVDSILYIEAMTQFHVISMLTAFNHLSLDSQCSLGASNINISRVFINFPWTINHNNIQQLSCSFTWSSELGRWFSRRAKSPLVCVPNKRKQWANWTLRTLWDWNESWMNNYNNITLLFVCSQKTVKMLFWNALMVNMICAWYLNIKQCKSDLTIYSIIWSYTVFASYLFLALSTSHSNNWSSQFDRQVAILSLGSPCLFSFYPRSGTEVRSMNFPMGFPVSWYGKKWRT